jgi:hypothetical protein
LPQGRSGVVVLDLSRSIGARPAKGVLRALRRLDSCDGRLGLVVFSDTAYELLPPGSPGCELKRIERFFDPIRYDKSGDPVFPVTPWDENFRGGTRISSGLALGWQSLKRAGVPNGAILIVSDLATEPDDLQEVVETGIAMRRAHVLVRILGLNPKPGDRALFARVFGSDAFVAEAAPVGAAGAVRRIASELKAPLPWALVVAALALLGALAANEVLCGRLTLPGKTA